MKRTARTILAMLFGAVALCGGAAVAQDGGGAPGAEIARRTADQLHRRATVWLRSLDVASSGDYRRAALTMSIAHRLAPDDAQFLRHQISAWDAAGDSERALRLTRELMRDDPKDTVAALRVINAGIGRLQDVDKRLGAYDRLLGPAGESIDASIRSRLALDAALLARETGDDRGFAERLLKATTFDVTNKDAVALQASYYLDRTRDASERFDLLSDVVLADPLDGNAYRNLSDEMIRNGAFRGAKRFLDIARMLEVSRGIEPTVPGVERYVTVLWNAEGPEAAKKIIDGMRNSAMSQEIMRRRQIEMQGLDPGPAEPVVVHPLLERLAMMIDDSMADPERARRAFGAVMLGYTRALDMAQDSSIWPAGTTPEEVEDTISEIKRERLWSRVLIGVELDEAEGDLLLLEGAEGAARPSEMYLTLCRGWLELHRRQFEAAREHLGSIAASHPAARYGLGLIAEQENDPATALKEYARTALFFPESAFGALGRTRIAQIRGRPLGSTEAGSQLESKARSFAPWLESMVSDPWSFMSIQAEHVRSALGPLDRPVLRVTVRNLSRMPLAVGPAAPIDSSILLSPKLMVGGEEKLSVTRPEILRLNQRLRLMPGESFQTTIWTNYGWIGTLCDLAVGLDVMLRWRLIQGFVVLENGAYEAGPLCLSVQSDQIRRANLDGQITTEELVAAIGSARGTALIEMISLAATRLVPAWKDSSGDAAVTARAQEDLARVIGERIATMDEWERVFAITRLGDAAFYTHKDRMLVDMVRVPAQAVDGVYSMTAYLTTFADRSDDPVIGRALAHPDADLSELASVVQTALRATEEAAEASPIDSGAAP